MDDVTGKVPSRYCSPRHRMPIYPIDEGSNALDDVASNIRLSLLEGSSRGQRLRDVLLKLLPGSRAPGAGREYFF